jgi:hypothetical protein
MIDPKQGPFPTPPRRGRSAPAWIEYQVQLAPWVAVDDPQDPGGRAIDAPDPRRPVAIDDPAPEPSEVPIQGRWMPTQPPREPGQEIPNDDGPGPTDHRPRPH